MAKPWWKYLLISSLGVVVLCCIGWLLLYRILVVGRTWKEPLGGSWFLKYRDTPLLHSGPQVSLFRKEGLRSVLVADLIYQSRFYGEDCVVYETYARGESGFRFLGACGARTPVVLVPPMFDEWELDGEGLKRVKLLGGAQANGPRITIGEIKRRARGQPPAFPAN